MKVYISGKITGLPANQVRAKFNSAEKHLASIGYKTVNPLNNGLTSEHTWAEHMVEDIRLLFDCDAIYLLSDWLDSRGALIEKHIAEILGLKMFSQSQDVSEAENKAKQEMILHKVELAIEDVTGLKREQYAVKSKDRFLYFLRMIYVYHCFEHGVTNRNYLGKRVDRDHATVYRMLNLYSDEIKVNPAFRELSTKISKRIDAAFNARGGTVEPVMEKMC